MHTSRSSVSSARPRSASAGPASRSSMSLSISKSKTLKGGSVSSGSTLTPANEFQKIYVKQCAAKNTKPDPIVISALSNAGFSADLDRMRIEAFEPLSAAFRLCPASLQHIRLAVNQIKKPADQKTTREPPILQDEKTLSALLKCAHYSFCVLCLAGASFIVLSFCVVFGCVSLVCSFLFACRNLTTAVARCDCLMSLELPGVPVPGKTMAALAKVRIGQTYTRNTTTHAVSLLLLFVRCENGSLLMPNVCMFVSTQSVAESETIQKLCLKDCKIGDEGFLGKNLYFILRYSRVY